MKAAFLDFATVASAELDVSPLSNLTGTFDAYDCTAADEVAARIADCEFAYINKVRMTREVIEGAKRLRFIGLTATGVDNVALDAAKERGVAVANIRAYCTNSVVEHVFAMLLSLSRSIGPYRDSVRRGDWATAANFCMLDHPIRELSAMSIGIVGYGELGQAVAGVARAFGMRVLVSGRPGAGAAGVDRIAFETLLETSDVVSLHCPLTEETRGLIGAPEFGRMKRNAILINTARGALVDSAALVDALENETIAAAGIDVLPQEPPVGGDPLLDYDGDNLLMTPHIAWATVEARQNAINETAANVAAFLAGGDRNRIV
ncbi:MAG: D-2-hydroxyacid dehydrogenase [Gammaproteobacteria bacterium]|nr:D-2-hydroxyacid dehydrogenase [Gammaproteobacteria bacterium]MDH5344653.1 D-2-hydroxyacid dehydrogenase [Gammaproteobacteria bacterium]